MRDEKSDYRVQDSWVPQFPASLPGTFWGITTFFNPCHYQIRIDNYRRFRESSKRQGLNLICVELAFGKSNYELNDADAELVVRVRTKSVLWQKERLLNIGLKYLPQDCDKIAWLDADVLFLNPRWVEQTSRLLSLYVVIQPFSCVFLLPKMMYQVKNGAWPTGVAEGHQASGIAYLVCHCGKEILFNSTKYGHPGLVWATRRNVFDQASFYDQDIAVTADSLMSYAFYGSRYPHFNDFLLNHNLIVSQNLWREKIYQKVRDSVYYVDGAIYHLWHGNYKNRFYGKTNQWLARCGFDPTRDIKLDGNGCWVWATRKPLLHLFCYIYFYLRNEEGVFWGAIISGIFSFMILLYRVLKRLFFCVTQTQ